jgi:arginase
MLMPDQWILTPQYFEHPEPALASLVPTGAMRNGPHAIPDRTTKSMATLHKPIAEACASILRDGNRPISVAGDCCASVPVLAALRTAGINPIMVWIDAHADFNTPETSPSQFLGGMPLAMMVGRGPQWMCEAVSLAPFPEDRVWLIDGRDLDPLERAALDASAVRRTGMAGLASLRFADPVFVHIDMDVLDADKVPAFNYPVPGGPGIAETTRACRSFAEANSIVAISVSGWTGSLDADGRTAAACKKVLDALIG